MLIGIDSRLGPDLLHVLASMGHGDTLAIVDGNYPAERDAKRLVRMNGHTVSSVLEAVLTVFPIETDQVTGWVPETERDIHLDLMKQVQVVLKMLLDHMPVDCQRPKDFQRHDLINSGLFL